jgi:hypothetical protein
MPQPDAVFLVDLELLAVGLRPATFASVNS